jgi:hypothetical protein
MLLGFRGNTMNDLLHHLKNAQLPSQFQAIEYTNAMRFLYTALLSAVDDGADKFVIRHNGFLWFKEDVQIGKYLGGNVPEPTPGYSAHFQIILDRDDTVRRYTRILSDTPEETVVEIVL